MDNKTLNRRLKQLSAASTKAAEAWADIDEHCLEVYGVTPSDVDCDSFLDACTGAGGHCSGMSVAEFNAEMKSAIDMKC